MSFSANRGMVLTSFMWLFALAAAWLGAYLRGVDTQSLLPVLGIASIPAVIALILWPFSRREWVQMLVIFAWIGLAIIASLAIAFVPMAILFLLAPAAAALFEREKVIEAMLFSAIFAAAVYYFSKSGYAPEALAEGEQMFWGKLSGIMATIAFLVGAMYVSARSNKENAGKNYATKTDTDILPNTIAPETVTGSELAQEYPGAAMKFTPSGRLVFANNKARQVFSLSKDELGKVNLDNLLSNESLSDILADNDIAQIVLPDELQCEHAVGLVIKKGRDNNIYAYSIDNLSKNLPWPKSEPDNYSQPDESVNAIRETARREAQEKTLFFAGVSHELRTPLNAIIGFSDMMRSRMFGPLPGKYAEYAELIHDSGQHMLDLVGDVLDMSKIEVGKYELDKTEFDMADVVRSSIKMVRPSADAAELVLDIDIEADTDLVIRADRRAVRQILLNLLSNAIKFTPKGGRVGTSVYRNNGFMEIIIKDNGSGMSEEELAQIGQPFSQAGNASLIKERSSGLGLSLVKNLVELHRGKFSIKSKKGQGTEVKILLPAE